MNTRDTTLSRLLRDARDWLNTLQLESEVAACLLVEALCHACGRELPSLRQQFCVTSIPLPDNLKQFPWRRGVFSAADIGELYLLLRSALLPADTATDGMVYTPRTLVDHMVQLLDGEPGMRWCDPACGSGAFLLGVRRKFPQAQVCGMDMDAGAVALVRDLIPNAELCHGDTLDAQCLSPPGAASGYERIIMNPPYRNAIETADRCWQVQRRRLQENFSTARGAFDLFVPFLERGLQWLAPGGKLAAVVPDKWLAAPYGRELRRLLTGEEYSLLFLEHAPRCDWFERADVEALVLLAQRKRKAVARRSELVSVRTCNKTTEGELQFGASHHVSHEQLSDSATSGWGWALRAPGQRAVAHKELRRIGDTYRVQASLSTDEFYSLQVEEEGEDDTRPRLLSSGSIDPFRILWGERVTRFRGQRLLHPVVLSESMKDSRLQQIQLPRVLLANLSTRLEACLPLDGLWLGVVNVMQIFCSDWEQAFALCAWLNSTPVNDWCDTHYAPLRMTGQLSITRSLVENLPAPPQQDVDSQRQDAMRLVALGHDMHDGAGTILQNDLNELALHWITSAEQGEAQQ